MLKSLDGQTIMPTARRTSPPPVAQVTRTLYEAMHRFDGAVADALGIHRSDLRCLNALEHGALPPGVIASRLGLTSGSVTALVDRLVRAGLVERHADALDRRSSAIVLTPDAYRRVDAEYAKLGKAIGARMQRFTAEQRALLSEALRQLATAFDDATARASMDSARP
jgi:DNA-binding MarR family transcriptional regulator